MGYMHINNIADIKREGEGEIVWENEMGKWIRKKTAQVFHQYLDLRLQTFR